jgi:ureidoglycolate hydrolase
MSKIIEVKQLTHQAYSKYGKIILLRPEEKPLADDNVAMYWSGVVDMEKQMDHYVSLLVEKKRPIELVKMERHVKCKEFFIPVDGDCVMFFAPAKNPDDPNEAPDANKIECFRMKLEGMIGFVINRGTWHFPAFPITATATQLIVMRNNLEFDDVQLRELPVPLTVNL